MISYVVEGIVQKGQQKARELHCPTANIITTLMAPYGVYSGKAYLHNVMYRALCYLSPSQDRIILEAHFLEYKGLDFYGAHISVHLEEFIRPIMKFDNITKLQAQIVKDFLCIR